MATLTVNPISRSGLTQALVAAAAGGDQFPNAGNVFLHVKNGAASPITVTIGTPKTVDGLAVADRAVVVTNGTEVLIGPFPRDTYNDATGNVQVTYSSETTVTVGAFSLTPVT